MDIKSRLATIKQQVRNGNDVDESISFDNLVLDVYTTQHGYLTFKIPETHGNPSSPKIQKLTMTVIFVFGVHMLPNPEDGTIRTSIKTSELQSDSSHPSSENEYHRA